jgi:hypothetical protein
MNHEPQHRRTPDQVFASLARLRRRARALTLAKGTGATVITSLTAAGAAMAVDRFVILYDPRVRMAISGAIFIVAAVVLLFRVFVPIMRRVSPAALAATFEDAYPDLQERLTAAVALTDSTDPPVIRGSDAMIAEVIREADAAAVRLTPVEVMTFGRAKRIWWVAAGLVLTATLLAAIWPGQTSLLARRLFTPNAKRAFLTDVTVDPTGATVPLGEPMQIEAVVTRQHARNCDLILRDGANETTIIMAPAETTSGQEIYRTAIPAVTDGMQYQVRANDAYTAWHTIRAVPRPRAERLDMVLTPPAYSALEPRTITAPAGDIECIRHTRLELSVTTNKPCDTAVLQFDDATTVEMSSETPTRYTAAFVALEDATFRARLTDHLGFANTEPIEHTIKVQRDEPPSVRIVSPPPRITVRPDESVPVRFLAVDDFAITLAELQIEVDAEPRSAIPITLRDQNAEHVDETAVLDLAALELAGARQIRYRVAVADSLPSKLDNGPQRSSSPVQVILLDATADDYALQALRSLRQQFREGLDRIDRNLAEAEIRSTRLKSAAEEKRAFNVSAVRSAEEARTRLRESQRLAHDLARATTGSEYHPFGETLRDEIADGAIAAARRAVAGGAMTPDDLDHRRTSFARAEQEIRSARKRIAEVAKRLDELAQLEEAAHRLTDAANQQSDIAEKLKAGDDAQALGNLAPDQQKLLDAVQQILAENPAMLRKALENQQPVQKALTEKLAELAARENRLRQTTDREQLRRDIVGDTDLEPEPNDLFTAALQAHARPLPGGFEQLAKTQRELADAASALAAKLNDTAPDPIAEQAAARAQQAAQDMQDQQPGLEIRRQQQRSAEQLDQLSAKLAQPAETVEHDAAEQARLAYERAHNAEQANRLADTQRLLTDELDALQTGRPHHALAVRQERLRKQTRRLGVEAAILSSQIAGLKPGLGASAEAASKLAVETAPKAQAAATENAHNDQLPQASENMAAAQRALEQAAKGLASALQQLTQAAPEGGETTDKLAGAMSKAIKEQAESLENMNQAQQQTGQGEAQSSSGRAGLQAQTAAAQAAASLRMTAQQFMNAANSLNADNPLADRTTKESGTGQGLGSLGSKTPDPVHLDFDLLGMTRSQWARLPGTLREEVLQAAEDEAPAEYRQLVQEYFRHIAQHGSDEPTIEQQEWTD